MSIFSKSLYYVLLRPEQVFKISIDKSDKFLHKHFSKIIILMHIRMTFN